MQRLALFSSQIVCILLCGAANADSAYVSSVEVRVPAYLIEVPESVTDILIADTNAAAMHRFKRAGIDVVEIDKRYMSIGLNGVPKQRAWDKKTPLGVYFITERVDTEPLHDRYGVAAFPLDYPNAWDRLNARTGQGIWIHGVDHKNPLRPPLDTDGCLALPNEEIMRIADDLEPFVTPVIVARDLRWSTIGKIEALRTEFRIALDMWRQSLRDGDLIAYLSLYAEGFGSQGMDKEAWSTYRHDVFNARELQSVDLADVLLLKDPEEPELYLSRFNQVLTTPEGIVSTTKRLYWRRTPNNRWQIVSEDAG